MDRGGPPADAAQYHEVLTDGETTGLGDDMAFTAPAGKTQCLTDAMTTTARWRAWSTRGPPPRPPAAYGQWKGGWMDFAGTASKSAHPTEIRAVHSGRRAGAGLRARSLAFGDNGRTDPNGVTALNYATRGLVPPRRHRGVRLSAAGHRPPEGPAPCSAADRSGGGLCPLPSLRRVRSASFHRPDDHDDRDDPS